MKRLLPLFVLTICIWGLALLANAQEPVTVLQYTGGKIVSFDPSPDARAVGYILFFDDGEVEWNSDKSSENTSGNWLTDTSFQLEEGRLHPGKTYTITAIAYAQNEDRSVRSEPLVVSVLVDPLPEPNMMPLYVPMSAPGTLVIQGGI